MMEHTIKAFDVDLQELARMIAEMGGLAERQIGDALDALNRHDAELARSVLAADARIDALQREIGGILLELEVRFIASDSGIDGIAFCFEIVAKQQRQRFLVLDNQDACRHDAFSRGWRVIVRSNKEY